MHYSASPTESHDSGDILTNLILTMYLLYESYFVRLDELVERFKRKNLICHEWFKWTYLHYNKFTNPWYIGDESIFTIVLVMTR
jgi:hypothetical protein